MQIQLTEQLTQPQPKKLLKRSKPTPNSGCIVILVDDEQQVLAQDKLTEQKEHIEQLIEQANFKGKLGETLADYGVSPNNASKASKKSKQASNQLLLVGIGKQDKLSNANLQKISKAIYQALHNRTETATIIIGNEFDDSQFAQFTNHLLASSYRFDKYKSDSTDPVLQTLYLLTDDSKQSLLDFALAVNQGQTLTRNVANEPGNVCYPEYMAQQAQRLAKKYPDLLKVQVIDQKKMAKLGMECFLAVAKGSEQEGKLVILEYRGKSDFGSQANSGLGVTESLKAVAEKLPNKLTNKKGKNKAQNEQSEEDSQTDNTTDNADDAPIVLVGKGVTFDSGGISIKPGAGMDEMKFDMGGSASVLGTIKALCESRLPINVVGALACAENMPSGHATRPGDIVKAMNGKTVEILNTDAEGRLVLADTLCYVQRYQPKVIIDVATLTGACVIALGHVRSAVYSNDEDLLFALENASEQSGDLIWHMPLDNAYQSQLDSPIADMQNIGGRAAGSVTAACFLSRFVEEGQAWAHLDIAGTAWNSGKEKGATGRPVPLFMQYLKNIADAK